MEKTQESNVVQLLTDVAEEIKRFEAKWWETGEKYNLFKIADIEDDEVIMCRVLADLLDPHGKHCQDSHYLDLFWKAISLKLPKGLELRIKDTRVKTEYGIKVTTEYGIDKNRRIDITLDDGRILVPIEVKIGAGDQPKQVADYYEFARKKNKGVHVPLLYLTVDGHEPTDFSKVGIGKDDYVTLSFRDDILAWLEECWGKTPETMVPVRESLRQYIAAIKSLCGKSEDKEMEDAIFKLVTEGEPSVLAALKIRGVLDFANRALETFKGPVVELVQKELDAEAIDEEGWNYIGVPIKDGRYWFEINYLWDKAGVWAENAEDATNAEGKALNEKMSELFGIQSSPSNGNAWIKDGITWPDFARDELYEFRLYKLYTEHPQEVAGRIIKIARELEDVKV